MLDFYLKGGRGEWFSAPWSENDFSMMCICYMILVINVLRKVLLF